MGESAAGQDGKSPHPIDVHVGARIRMRRKLMSITQEQLAKRLGLTFQQIQKYERGANRVSASKLYEIAIALDASMPYFFEGLQDPTQGMEVQVPAEAQTRAFLSTDEGIELAQLFPHIHDGKIRRQVLSLVRSLVGGS